MVAVTIDGDEVTFDFTGTDEQRPGNVNAVEAVTISAVAYALRSATDPTIPANGGAMRPVSIVAPPGTLVAARPPAAVGAGNVEVSQRVADVCFGALAQACPDRVGRRRPGHDEQPSHRRQRLGLLRDHRRRAGRPPGPGPGMSGVHTGMTNTQKHADRGLGAGASRSRVPPATAAREAAEQGWRPAATASSATSRCWKTARSPDHRAAGEPAVGPRQVAGPGAPGENWLLPGGDEARPSALADKCTVQLRAGDVLRMLTPGGGGWGKPPDG